MILKTEVKHLVKLQLRFKNCAFFKTRRENMKKKTGLGMSNLKLCQAPVDSTRTIYPSSWTFLLISRWGLILSIGLPLPSRDQWLTIPTWRMHYGKLVPPTKSPKRKKNMFTLTITCEGEYLLVITCVTTIISVLSWCNVAQIVILHLL